MHYYKRNLGDYAKKAGRLSMLQHGAYTLLIDACYDREQFPTRDEAIDWAWASSAAEVEAVDFVLSKFFCLEGGRYIQKRIQEEIAAYHETAKTNRRIAAEREAKRKASAAKRARVVDEACTDGHLTKNQEPITKNQEPNKSKHTPSGSSRGVQAQSDAGRACLLMRQAGCVSTNPSHPDLLASLAEGVTPEALADTVAEGLARSPPVGRPFAWAISTARSRNAEGPSTVVPISGARNAAPVRSTSLSAVERVHRNAQRMLDAEQRRAEADPGPGILEGHCHAVGAHD